MSQVTERKNKKDWAHFIKEIADIHYKDAKKITLVMDNLNTHKAASLYEAFNLKAFLPLLWITYFLVIIYIFIGKQ